VALARTLAIEPRVLLLDEPLSNLDAKLRVHMRRELLAMQRKLGITTIFVTHDQEEAMTTADRIAVMNEGVIQQVGSPVELYDRPVNRFVAEFVGTINLLAATLGPDSLECEFGRIDRAALGQSIEGDGAVLMALRPHSLQILAANNPRRGERQDLLWHVGQVVEREFLGEFIRYRVRARSAELILDEAHRAGDAGHPVGSEVVVGLDPKAVGVLRN
jgi:iron(III) transport system ATP-binding protein